MNTMLIMFALIFTCSLVADTVTTYEQNNNRIVIKKNIIDTANVTLPANRIFSAEECQTLIDGKSLERNENSKTIEEIFPWIIWKRSTANRHYHLDTAQKTIMYTTHNQSEEKTADIGASIFFILIPLSIAVIAGIRGIKTKALASSLFSIWVSTGIFGLIMYGAQMEGTRTASLFLVTAIGFMFLVYQNRANMNWVKAVCFIISFSTPILMLYASWQIQKNYPDFITSVFTQYFLFNLGCLLIFWIVRKIKIATEKKKLQSLGML